MTELKPGLYVVILTQDDCDVYNKENWQKIMKGQIIKPYEEKPMVDEVDQLLKGMLEDKGYALKPEHLRNFANAIIAKTMRLIKEGK